MSEFDYIVVGAGSAGAIVAARLSEDPGTRVLLLEAGGSHKHLNVQMPAAFAKQFKSKLDWNFETEPEPHLNGRRIYQPRGKMLGGCSSMNAMMYIRGSRHDFDDWAAGGATGWSYDDVLPLFKRTEHNSRGAGEFHGDSGPMYIEDLRTANIHTATIIDSMVSTGMPRNDDFNGAEQVGAGYLQVNQHRGRRWTTADGFVLPAEKRPNLTVLTNTGVDKLRIEGGRAVGVEVTTAKGSGFHRAEREVILSAGAFNTPQLLMLSGIGPADHLAEHGIATLVDNPNVGDHLMDHPFFVVGFESTAKGTLAEAQSPVQLTKYFVRHRGMLTSNVGESAGFFHTRSGDKAPDMEMIGAPVYYHNHGFDTWDKPALGFALSLVGPKSRGHIRLRSADPRDKVSSLFNYCADPADVEALVTGIERAREASAYAPLAKMTTKELHPGAALRTRAELAANVRAEVEHTYHASCTARIGSETTGVVGADLRVHGVEGLRVADASVFPTITHGNTHAPSMMVGEKAADLIRGDA